MDIFSQKKLLVRIVILLTALNLLSMGVFLWKDFFYASPDSPNSRELRDARELRDLSVILETELDLNKTQVEQIKKLRSKFFQQEKALANTIRSKRDSMNSEMFNEVTDENLVRALAKRISENEYKMELLRFEQAKELKSICTPKQLEKFKDLVIEIREYFRPNPPPRRR
jgi:hypothetical protein